MKKKSPLLIDADGLVVGQNNRNKRVFRARLMKTRHRDPNKTNNMYHSLPRRKRKRKKVI